MKYVIANWKMNLPKDKLEHYLKEIDAIRSNGLEIIIAPPSPYIALVREKYPNILLACQDFSNVKKEYGSFTGEVGSKMMSILGIRYSIIGHSERRKNFEDTNEKILSKTKLALDAGIKPIICIGENFKNLECPSAQTDWKEFLDKQIQDSLLATKEEILVAYEPVWAIGSGLSASIDEIIERSDYIAKNLNKVAKRARLVYGGSVTSQNAPEIAKIERLSGVLVGNASLDIDEFIKIVKAYA